MPSDDYRRALDVAVREYETLGAERRRIEARLAQLAHTIGALMQLCGLSPTVQWGLTDSVRAVLQASDRPLTAMEVRDRLAAMGFDLTRYASGLAAIHTVLKRLDEANQAHAAALGSGKQGFRWKGPPRAIAIDEAELRSLIDPGVEPVRPRKGKPR